MSEPLELKKTLNLPKTDFPMKASLPLNEPKQLEAWQEAESLPADSGSAQRQAALCAARWAALSHGHDSSRHRPEQNSERPDRQDQEHGRPLRALRARLGLPRPAHRNAGRKRTRRQRQSSAGGIPQALPRVRDALRRAAQEGFQAPRRFRPLERSLSHDELRLRSHHRRRFPRFHGKGLRLSRTQAGLLVHLRSHRARRSRSRIRRSHQPVDLGEVCRGWRRQETKPRKLAATFQRVIWTTTPWTIPHNRALAFHPDYEYAVVANRKRRSCCSPRIASPRCNPNAKSRKPKFSRPSKAAISKA